MPRSLLPVLTGLVLGACAHTDKVPDAPAATSSECAAADLERTLVSEPSARVIVLLHPNAQEKAKLLEELGPDFQLARSYDNLPGFAGTITRHGYELARAHRDVRCIQLDHPGSGGG